jgi:DNA polymerase-3 subunit delta'
MTFRDLVGHRTTLGLISARSTPGALPPTLILARVVQGVGAALLVLGTSASPLVLGVSLAAFFEREACGQCPPCRRIARGQHPDVRIVEPGETGIIAIEGVRKVIYETGFKPFEARKIVAIFETMVGGYIAGRAGYPLPGPAQLGSPALATVVVGSLPASVRSLYGLDWTFAHRRPTTSPRG